MCGRYASTQRADDLSAIFDAETMVPEALPPDYNVAPTKPVYAVTRGTLTVMRWGLVPPWADGPAVGSRMINARAETLCESRAYAPAAAHRRCLIPADGWYEWAGRQPYYLHAPGEEPLAFAGLWETWHGNGQRLVTCTIVTTAATPALSQIHDRMPLVVPPARWSSWLDADRDDPRALLAPDDDLVIDARPVGRAVGNVANNDPGLRAEVAPQPEPQTLF